MADIKAHLHALADGGGDQPLGFTAGDVIAAARPIRRRRRRRLRIGAAGLAGAAAVAAVASLTLPAGSAVSPVASAKALSLTALTKTAASPPANASPASSSVTVNGVSASQVVAAAERAVGAPLVSVQVSTLSPTKEMDLSATIGTAGGPYLNVQVSPAHTLSTARPTCAALSDLASGDGDGYYGPCSISRLSDGALLIARSGQLASSDDAMAQATLIRPDGSGVFAEDTNTTITTPAKAVKLKTDKGKFPPAVASAAPADSAALVTLVQALASGQS